MEFFNGIGKAIQSTAKSVSEKTKGSVEATKLTLNLKALKGETDHLYTRLGKLFYTTKGEATEAMAAIVAQLDANQVQIEELTAKIDKANNVVRCAGCGKPLEKDAKFCKYCGAAVPAEPEKTEEAPVVETEAAPVCPDCGAPVSEEDEYCKVCGKDLKAAPEEEEAVEEPVEEEEEYISDADPEE